MITDPLRTREGCRVAGSARGGCLVGRCGRLRVVQGEVGVEVDVGGSRAFVAEPQGDHSAVNAGVQQSHRAGVA
jgi:hypothetical protein